MNPISSGASRTPRDIAFLVFHDFQIQDLDVYKRQVAGAADRVDTLIAQFEMAMDVRIPAVEGVDHRRHEYLGQRGRQRHAQLAAGAGDAGLQLLMRDARFIDEVPATLEVERASLCLLYTSRCV